MRLLPSDMPPEHTTVWSSSWVRIVFCKNAGPEITLAKGLVPKFSLFDQEYLTIWVSNSGDKSTTITTVGMSYYASRLRGCIGNFVRLKADKTWIINIQDLPATLEVGAQKCWPIPHAEPIEIAKRGGVLYCELYHALSRKPVRKQIDFSPASKT
jgi:hypothetical protein